MNLMNLIRSLGFLAIGWTVLALGVGALGGLTTSPPAANFFVPQPSLHQMITIGNPPSAGKEEVRLVDQVTGKSEPVDLPAGEIWALLTVSPWRDQDGNLEVVGRWARHLDPPGEQPFSGLGRFRLSDGRVLSHIPLDVVPTGRPCIFPGRPGEILFPTGDGQLYRCSLSENSRGDADSTRPLDEGDESSGTGTARPVSWDCEPPSTGQVNIDDPFWSPKPSLRDYVFVSLSTQKRVGKIVRQEPQKLWWLKMNEEYDEIQAAGPLNSLAPDGSTNPSLAERFPTVVIEGEGNLSLVYIDREHPKSSWRLQTARLELNRKTGEPYLVRKEKPADDRVEHVAPDAPVVSADGKRVFAKAITGELVAITLAGER